MNDLLLRYYQADALRALDKYFQNSSGNPCIEIPTAGGKTILIAQLCYDWVEVYKQKVMVLAHVKELVGQAIKTISEVIPVHKIGCNSASLGARDCTQPVICANIQSVFRNPEDFGQRSIVIVDEAHRIPSKGDGMYRQFILGLKKQNPHVRIVGMTATPFRTKSGMVCGSAKDGFLLNDICYRISVKELLKYGYISDLSTKGFKEKIDFSGLKKSCGEFLTSSIEDALDDDDLHGQIVDDIIKKTRERKKNLVFCASVMLANKMAVSLQEKGLRVSLVTGETPDKEREQAVQRFREGGLDALVNVSVFVEGFDVPDVDTISMVVPTASPGKYYQMVGRGFRITEGKSECLILDYGQNIERHGPVDEIAPGTRGKKGGTAPVKMCPECQEICLAGVRHCPVCGFEFEFDVGKPELESESSKMGILSGDGCVSTVQAQVHRVSYRIHQKRESASEDPRSMRVTYYSGMEEFSEYVCFEHEGYPRNKAIQWWTQRTSAPVPSTAADAVRYASEKIDRPSCIVVKQAPGKYPQIMGVYGVTFVKEPNINACSRAGFHKHGMGSLSTSSREEEATVEAWSQ